MFARKDFVTLYSTICFLHIFIIMSNIAFAHSMIVFISQWAPNTVTICHKCNPLGVLHRLNCNNGVWNLLILQHCGFQSTMSECKILISFWISCGSFILILHNMFCLICLDISTQLYNDINSGYAVLWENAWRVILSKIESASEILPLFPNFSTCLFFFKYVLQF